MKTAPFCPVVGVKFFVNTNAKASSPIAQLALGSSMGQTVTSLPYRAAAGDSIAGPLAAIVPTLPPGVLTVDYYELAVASVDGAEQIVAYNDASPTLAAGTNYLSDLGSSYPQIGSDLTLSGLRTPSLAVSTTAGGVFVVQATLQLIWTPA